MGPDPGLRQLAHLLDNAAKYAGLATDDAHVIRNPGGRASDDAIWSLAISHKLPGTREWFVIHHTDCGMRCSQTTTCAILW